MCDFGDMIRVRQPTGLNVKLMFHQSVMVSRMEKLEREQSVCGEGYIKEVKIGVLSEPQGMGKCVSVIALMIRDKLEWDMSVPYVSVHVDTESSGLITRRFIHRKDKLSCNLVLVSSRNFSKWKEEFSGTCLSICYVDSELSLDSVDAYNYDVVLCSSTFYNRLVNVYENCAWKRFIFDDPESVKVSSMKKMFAGFTWFISCNVNGIYKKYKKCHKNTFMRSIVDASIGAGLTIADYLQEVTFKSPLHLISHSCSVLKIRIVEYKCLQTPVLIKSGTSYPNLRKMLDGGYIEDAIVSMGVLKSNNMIEFPINRGEGHVEDTTLDSGQLEDKRRRVWEHTCHICMDTVSSPLVVELNCKNIFCGECFLRWFDVKQNCPMCRRPVGVHDIVYLDRDCKRENTTLPTKEDTVVKIIQNFIDDQKTIVFSLGSKSIKRLCRDNSIDYLESSGMHNMKVVNKYKKQKSSVLFVDEVFLHKQMNLRETTSIIFVEDGTKENESHKQKLISFANRIGRKDVLTLHVLKLDI